MTDEIIPDQILKIIQRGPSFPCGGSPQQIALLGEFDNLLDFLKKNKQFLELPDITKLKVKVKLIKVLFWKKIRCDLLLVRLAI